MDLRGFAMRYVIARESRLAGYGGFYLHQDVPFYMQQLESLPAMVAGVYSDDPATQLEATTQFRKLLSIGMELVVLGHVLSID